MALKKPSRKTTVFLFLVLLLLAGAWFFGDASGGREPSWGVTFTPSYASYLGLDWPETYLAILDDLGVDHLRLAAYWNEIEVAQDQYDFSQLDWQVAQASQRGVKLILAFGRRLPRWPECHDPDWLVDVSVDKQKNQLLELVELVVNRYKDNPSITHWQVENEPLFRWFGQCPPPDKEFLKQEVALVKFLDPSRPIVITDSGELSSWQSAAGVGDILGTTLYRIVWNRWLGFFEYWFTPPLAYSAKAAWAQFLNPQLQAVIITELQMEPWATDKPLTRMSLAEQQRSFDLNRFRKNLNYARRTGLAQAYLWGAEYWYWLKTQGQPAIWQEAKKLW